MPRESVSGNLLPPRGLLTSASFDHFALGLDDAALSFDRVPEGIEVLLLQRCHALSVGLLEVLPKRGHPFGCGLGWAESNDWVRDHEPLLFWTAFLWFPCLFGHVQLCWLSARAVGCGPRRPHPSPKARRHTVRAHSLPRGRDRGDCSVRGTGRDKRDQLDGLPRRFGMRSQVIPNRQLIRETEANARKMTTL